MSRIKSCFEKLGAENRKALIPYVTAGDPDPSVTVAMMVPWNPLDVPRTGISQTVGQLVLRTEPPKKDICLRE